MALIYTQDGLPIMKGQAVAAAQECCCGGVCCVNGTCDSDYATQEECEQCDPVIVNGFPTGQFIGGCGKWLPFGTVEKCSEFAAKCDTLPASICIDGLPAEWDAFSALSLNGSEYVGDVFSPTQFGYMQSQCGGWLLVITINPSFGVVKGISVFLPETPEGECFFGGEFLALVRVSDSALGNSTEGPYSISISAGPC